MPFLNLPSCITALPLFVSSHQNTLITDRPHPRIDERRSLCPCPGRLLVMGLKASCTPVRPSALHPKHRGPGINTCLGNLHRIVHAENSSCHPQIERFDVSRFLRYAVRNLADRITRPRYDFVLLSVEHIHPAQVFGLGYPPQISCVIWRERTLLFDRRRRCRSCPLPRNYVPAEFSLPLD